MEFGLVLGIIITFAFIGFIAHGFVEGYTEGKNTCIWVKLICKVILGLFLFGALMLLGKCGCASGYEYSPSGETNLEHYEPR